MKKILISLAAFIIVIVILINTSWFKNYVFEFVGKRIEQQTGMRVTIGGFNYQFPLEFSAHNIALGSPEDPDLTIAEFNFSGSLSALWENEIRIQDLNLQHVVFHRTFKLPSSEEKSDKPWQIPIPCTIQHFQVDDLSLSPYVPPINLSGNLQAIGTSMKMELIAEIEEGKVTSVINYSSSKGFNLNINPSQLGPVDFEGTITISPNSELVNSHLNIKLRELQFLNQWIPSIKGFLEATCTLSGPITDPHLQADLQSNRLQLLGHIWDNFKTHIDCQYSDDLLRGIYILASKGQDYQLDSSAKFEWNLNKIIKLHDFSVKGPLTNLIGFLNADFDKGEVQAEFEGNTEDLTFLHEIFDSEAQGSLAFHTKLYVSPSDGQHLDLRLESPKLRFGELSAQVAVVDAHITKLFTHPEGSVQFNFQELNWDQSQFKGFSGESHFDTSSQKWPFKIACQSGGQLFTDFISHGTWDLKDQTTLVEISECKFLVFEQTVSINQPVTIRHSSEILNITPFSLQLGETSLQATLDLSKQTLNSEVRIQNFPLEWIHRLDPTLPIQGILNANFSLNGETSRPEGKFDLQVRDLKIQEAVFTKLPPLQGEFKVELKNNALHCDGLLTGLEDSPITLYADVPVSISLNPFEIRVERNEPLAAKLIAKGDVIPLLQLIFTDTNTLSGETEIAIEVAGSLENPQVKGNVLITNGTYENEKSGAYFKDIQAHFEALGKEVALKDFTAVDRYQGKVGGKGLIQLDSSADFPYDFHLDIENARFFNIDYADAVFTGKAQFQGNKNGALLKGQLTADTIKIVIPEELPTSTQTVDFTFVKLDPVALPPQEFLKANNEWPIHLDIAMEIPNNFTIDGNNLNTSWKGNINLKGTTETPEAYGELKVKNGSYIFNGKEFLINQGAITFNGDPEKKTSLYVIASQDLGKIIAEIILRGSIKNPTISFRSNPPLSQREILAWILFGRGVSDISGTEGAQLNQSITNLKTNNSKGPDMLTRLRNTFGVDRIDINRGDNEDSNQVSVQVGKYLSRGVYVSVSKSVTADANQVAIEAALTREIKIQGEVGDDSEGQLLLKWKKDY